MLTVNVICIGSLKEKYLKEAVAEYQKRLKAFCKFEIIELPEQKLPDNPSENEIKRALKKEAEKIISKIPKGSAIISMAIEGKELSSEQLAEKISAFSLRGFSTVSFVIGSSFGLCDEMKQESDFLLSMSKMTFPHQLARLMLCEQIFRAIGIIYNTKYHK